MTEQISREEAIVDLTQRRRLLEEQTVLLDISRDLAVYDICIGALRALPAINGDGAAQSARIAQLERQLRDFQASQHYRYIGKDRKPVLARELEDRAIRAENELAAAKQAVRHANDHADAAIASLAAERKRAQNMHRRAQKAEGKCLRLEWWHRVISGIAKHRKDWRLDQYARAGLRGSALHMGAAFKACAEYWRREAKAELVAEKALADGYAEAFKIGPHGGVIMRPSKVRVADAAYRKARGL